jgi:branched-chain amino acid transport system permease protein
MGLNLTRSDARATAVLPVGASGEPRPRRNILALAVAVAMAAALFVVLPIGLAGQPYWLSVATNANALSVGALGLWLMFSIGRIDIGQAAFAAVGGYTTAILTTRYGLSFWLCLPLSATAAAALAAVIGVPILRLRGVYFSMITLILTEVTRLALLNGGALTNGAAGITGIPEAALLDTPLRFYLLSAALALFAALLTWRISASRIGSVFRSMRQNEALAASLGIDVTRYRVIAFALASGLGGLAGGFLAQSQQNIFPATYTISDSISFMLYCFLGGLDYVLGPLVGAYLLVFAFELLDALQRYQALLYGILMIAVILLVPNGLLSLGRSRTRR